MKTENLDRLARHVGRVLVGREPPAIAENALAILSLCAHHNLVPLLGYRLRQARAELSGAMTDDQREMVKRLELEAKARYALSLEALGDALALLDPYRPVLFKGIAAAQAWPLPGLRDPGDLDLLVPLEAFPAAKKELLEAGWIEQHTVHGHLDDSVAEKFGFARVFRHPAKPVVVDLHRELVDRTEPFRVHSGPLYESAVLTKLSDRVVVRVPGPVEHLCLLALHAVRHGTFRLQGFVDIYLWLERYEGVIDNMEIKEYARQNKILRGVSVALLAAHNLFGGLPLAVRGLLETPSVRVAASRRSPAVLARAHMTRRGGVRRVLALVDLLDNPLLVARYLVRLAFPAREIVLSGSGSGFVVYFRRRMSAFLNLLPGFERQEKDS